MLKREMSTLERDVCIREMSASEKDVCIRERCLH